ncbi:hypothetical protein DFH08DRAFT_826711 [Mycena albidolilacea]|uniref:Novel STAND NTPase 1 domain-containing protein n=1 Tax=Mycena albidolilacea TaxID=1033008 RepID=A0AAD6YZN2_9AGAR|nr:hypothetical protein DFH08DRAFT_826711 [Mycena albidolilacea]
MPRQPTVTEIHLDNITACLTPALTLLNELNNAFSPPFLQSISNTIRSLINAVQSETPGFLPLAMLDHIGKFMETLHKIYTFIEAQQNGKKIKQLFRNREMKNLLEDCHAGLYQAQEVFGTSKKEAELMHKQLLELIQTCSDASTISDASTMSYGSLVYWGANELKNSSNSFSMLPSKPKIFHGRESDLDKIMKMLSQQSPRIAILGGGGMGKTSLATAVLHHPDTSAIFKHRFFVSAESATTSIELATLIGLHVGLNPGQDLTKPVIQYFSRKPSCLLILDNLETVWEPIKSRSGIEEFLNLLTEVEHLALIITMRGAERPAKVQWTYPLLLPLQPLSNDAAHQTFMDITDNAYAIEDTNQLLQFTDNMPLAVDLIAHLVDYEGLSNVLTRWETEKTSLLSVGHDRKSNLDASISLSLSSPRITSDSKELLSLLSILPNGLSDAELVQSGLPIPNILGCKAILQATSLVYQDGNKRLLSLIPVREHIQRFLPPSQSLMQSLRKHFYELLELYQKYNGEQLRPVVNQITLNLGNLQEVLQRGLYSSDPNLADTIYCTLSLNSFYRLTGRGSTWLMDHIQSILPQPCDHRLEIHLLIEVLKSYRSYPTHIPEQLITQAITHFQHVKDHLLESKFCEAVGMCASDHQSDSPRAMQFFQQALELSKLCDDSNQQCGVLICIAWLKYNAGDYCTAQIHASEAQRLSKLSADLYQEARAHQVGGACCRILGDYQESMAQLHRARKIIGICGLSEGYLDRGITLDQAEIHLLKSEYVQARSIFSQVVEATSADQNAHAYACALLSIALIDVKIGVAADNVYQNLNKAKDILRYNHLWGIPICDMIQADMELRGEKFDLARVKFQECLHSAWGIDNATESFCLEGLANIKAWHAIRPQYMWPVIYVGHAHKSKSKLGLHKGLLFLGDVFIAHNDEETAMNLYMVALEGFTHMDVHYSRAQCMLRLGDLANKQGNTSAAIGQWKAAQLLLEQSLQAKDVAQIDSRLATIEKAHQKALVELGTLHAPGQFLNKETSEIGEVRDIVYEDAEDGVAPIPV